MNKENNNNNNNNNKVEAIKKVLHSKSQESD
jgi:hypothetical protein